MARHKNANWNLREMWGWEDVKVAVLMDIRDELQTLNSIMRCSNVSSGFRALGKMAQRDERAFKRRVESAVLKRLERKQP